MQISIADARPPYVEFEVRPVEDRNASIREGRYIAKDVIFALVTPSGSKDRVERIATEWLAHIAEEARKGRFNQSWVDYYQSGYQRFKEGQEIPEFGTALRQWPGISPAQLKMLTDINIRTVEDLASATEEAVSHMGMGSRALIQRAKEFLANIDVNRPAEEVAALREEVARLTATNADLQKSIAELQAQTGTKPVRPQKPEKDE